MSSDAEKRLPMVTNDVWLTVPTGRRTGYLPDLLANSGVPEAQTVIVSTVDPDLTVGDAVVIPDLGPVNIHRWWNTGIDYAQAHGAKFVAVLNDDIRLTPDVIPSMAYRLWTDDSALCFVSDRQWMTGWAFMLNLASGVRPDERYRWWYGDDDLVKQAEAASGVVHVTQTVEHLHPNLTTSTSRTLQELADADRVTFESRWGQ